MRSCLVFLHQLLNSAVRVATDANQIILSIPQHFLVKIQLDLADLQLLLQLVAVFRFGLFHRFAELIHLLLLRLNPRLNFLDLVMNVAHLRRVGLRPL